MTIYLAGSSDSAQTTASLLRGVNETVSILEPDSELPSPDVDGHNLLIVLDAEGLDLVERRLSSGSGDVPVCLVHAQLAEETSFEVDDVFLSPDELLVRLPYLRRRADIRDSRSREYAAIFELTVDGIIVIDQKGIVRAFNQAATQIFGYERDEIIGRNVKVLMPQPYRREHDGYIRRYLETGHKRIIGIGREVTGRRKNGEVFPIDLAVSEVPSEGELLFTGLVRDITDRRQLEHEVLRMSEQERRRIGQDLHDGLGQMLTGLGLITRNLAHRLEKENSDSAVEMKEVSELIHEADQMARNLARGLVPVELQGDGISAAMRRLCSSVERLFGVTVTYEESGDIGIEDTGTASNLYRIAQEAVSNAVKHGRATNITVRLAADEDALRLAILDDGVGFPEEVDDDRGMGVRIMGHRARVIGAVLDITNRPEGGTAVICSLSFSTIQPTETDPK